MNPLIHLIYASAAQSDLDAPELTDLLQQARSGNERLGVTGMLLYAKGSFFQVLEGEAGVVDALFARIALDARHAKAITIVRESIARRSFAECSMGFSTITRHQIRKILGINDFFVKASCFAELDAGRARKLRAAFVEGRWRGRLGGAARAQPAVLEPALAAA